MRHVRRTGSLCKNLITRATSTKYESESSSKDLAVGNKYSHTKASTLPQVNPEQRSQTLKVQKCTLGIDMARVRRRKLG